MDFVYVPPANIRSEWTWVREGLEKVRDKGHDDWISEDIYCDCFEQRAMLWIRKKKDGFMILQPIGKSMHIWAAWLDSKNPEDLLSGMETVKEIARHGGCTSVTFSSVRSGWVRKAKLLGAKPSTWEVQL
jgi:hypothetical protein